MTRRLVLLVCLIAMANCGPKAAAPVVKALDHLLGYAFEQRASDIHFEPKRNVTLVRRCRLSQEKTRCSPRASVQLETTPVA